MASPRLKRRVNVTETLPRPVRSSSSNPRPFYDLPDNKPTAAQIVRESRDWLQAVSTRRPCTPKDQTRSLFGASNHNVTSRPISAFKLSAKNFDPFDVAKSRCPPLLPVEQRRRSPKLSELDGTNPTTEGKNRVKKRENALKRFTSFEGALPNPRGMSRSATTSNLDTVPNSAVGGRAKQSQLGLHQTNELQLELRGTQTKLLSHSQARLISPTLAHSSKSVSGSTDNLRKGSAANMIQEVASTKRQQSAKFNQVPTPTRMRSNSRTKTPQKLLDRVELNSDVDSQSEMQVEYHQERSPSRWSLSISTNNQTSQPNSPVNNYFQSPPKSSESIRSTEVVKYPVNSVKGMHSQKPLSGGHLGRKSQDVNLYSSPSGDSGLSSGSELDHLISRLSEFPQLLSTELSNRESECDSQAGRNLERTEEPVVTKGIEVERNGRIEEDAIKIANRLYTTLRETGIHEKPTWSGRPLILQAIFALLDKTSAKLHVALIRIIFMLQVSGSNLVNSCKLLYGIAKDSANDHLFMEDPDTLDILIHTLHTSEDLISHTSFCETENIDQSATLDALLFLTGTLKFLSASPVVSDKLNVHAALIDGLQKIHQQVTIQLEHLIHSSSEKYTSDDPLSQLQERLYHVLVQISEIFCNLSVSSGARGKLLSANGVMDHVINCIIYRDTSARTNQRWIPKRQTAGYLVYFNWIRLLARLTEYAEACQRLDKDDLCRVSHESLALEDSLELGELTSVKLNSVNCNPTARMKAFCLALKHMFSWFSDDEEFVVRLAYLLGNLTARLDSAREALFPDHDSLKNFCDLCYRYQKSLASNKLTVLSEQNAVAQTPNAWIDSTTPNQSNSIVQSAAVPMQSDVLDKLVRILANAAIGETVGRLAVTGPDCLNLFLTVIVNEFPRGPTELLLNCLAGLNNITYYINAETKPELIARQYDIAEALLRALTDQHIHPEILLGCIRIFGNLTRQPTLRLWLIQSGGCVLLETKEKAYNKEIGASDAVLQLLIENLDAAQPELVYSTLGVLINMMADVDQRSSFRKLGGLARLVAALRDFAGHDWQLAGLACKTLWNYTESPNEAISELIDVETMQELYHLLTDFTDENLVSRIHQSFLLDDPTAEPDSVEIWHAAWSSEFLPVATELVMRLTNQ